MLVKTSFNDSQVMYWEPAKYVAKLRTLKTDSNPLLLKTNMAGGHGGSSGRYDRYKERGLRLDFRPRADGNRPVGSPNRRTTDGVPAAACTGGSGRKRVEGGNPEDEPPVHLGATVPETSFNAKVNLPPARPQSQVWKRVTSA